MFLWYFVLGPVFTSNLPPLAMLVSIAYPIGDLGHPQVDAQLLELILVNDTIVAQLLRDHGIHERLLRETFGAADAGD